MGQVQVAGIAGGVTGRLRQISRYLVLLISGGRTTNRNRLLGQKLVGGGVMCLSSRSLHRLGCCGHAVHRIFVADADCRFEEQVEVARLQGVVAGLAEHEVVLRRINSGLVCLFHQ